MDNREEVKAFLTSRRARLPPESAGLAPSGRNRRVPGLRRSEVAELAGVSVEYYAQLERGSLGGVSQSVLDALARALQLDDAEREHLTRLAYAAGPGRRAPRRRPPAQVRPTIQRILDGMTQVPAIVNNGRLDALAANALGQALYAPVLADAAHPVNVARFNFLDPQARTFWGNWDTVADETVAMLRLAAGRDPFDTALTGLIGELSTHSDDFRTRWAAHDVRVHRSGTKHIRHPVVGDLHLSYDTLDISADPGLALVAFSAQAGSSSDDGLRFLASWAAVEERTDETAT